MTEFGEGDRGGTMRTHLDLCSGIGGFALAARWAGLQTIGFVEIDPWCRRVLAHHWPEAPQHDDVKTITPATVADWLAGQRLDILTAGYPCQPFSYAGKRRGAEDDRHLWPWIAALVSAVRPRWCLLENVAGHVSMGLDTVLSDLEAQDYTCWPVVIPAAGVGAPHRRDRVWIVGHANESGSQGRENGDFVEGQGKWEAYSAGSASHVADSGECGQQGHGPKQFMGVAPDGLSGWVVGHPEVNPWEGDWERGVSRVTAGEADRRHKLKALGNAIVPQVAYQILVAMLDAEGQSG